MTGTFLLWVTVNIGSISWGLRVKVLKDHLPDLSNQNPFIYWKVEIFKCADRDLLRVVVSIRYAGQLKSGME